MKNLLRLLPLVLLLAAFPACGDVPIQGYKVVNTFPHDSDAYTEGLFWHDGYLYESTGEVGKSWIRKSDLATGKVLKQIDLETPLYGEGIVALHGKLYRLTWRAGKGFVYDFDSFKRIGEFRYPGEGWGMTTDGSHLYMSDGTPDIRVLDPDTLQLLRKITVTWDGHEVARINELEWINGQIWANIWLTHRIARIDPATGEIKAFIDLSGLKPPADELNNPVNAVLNGIAYDKKHNRIFVTGKYWPHIYEIKIVTP